MSTKFIVQIPPALLLHLQEHPLNYVRINIELRHQQNHSLQVHRTFECRKETGSHSSLFYSLQAKKLILLNLKFLGGNDAVIHQLFVFPNAAALAISVLFTGSSMAGLG
jgi:hypothetical protein